MLNTRNFAFSFIKYIKMSNTQKILTLLETIDQMIAQFQQTHFNAVSTIEKDILKEKLRHLYSEIDVLETVNIIAHNEAQIIVPKETVIETAPIIAQIDIDNEPQIQEKEEQVAVIETNKVEDIIEKVVEQTIAEINKNDKYVNVEAFQKEIEQPRRDLREIIDLNKSFILKAELFQQNNDLYNQFVQEINQTRNEDNAIMVLNNWTMKMNWKREENKVYELLQKAVEKRFQPLIS